MENSAALLSTKAADVPAGLHPLLRSRWSPRAFSDRPVADADLELLLEAARWAPSAFNEQPWRFIVGRRSDPASHDQVLSTLNEFNQAWARFAPVLMLAVAKLTFTQNGKPNAWAQHDTGLALGGLLTQASALGLYVHFMAGFDATKAKELFHLSDDFAALRALAVGYLGDPDQLPPSLREKELAPRQRKGIPELIINGGLASKP